MVDKQEQLQEVINFLDSDAWKEIVLSDYRKELEYARDRNDMFLPGGDEEKDYLCGRIVELKKVLNMRDIYKKDLNDFISKLQKKGGE